MRKKIIFSFLSLFLVFSGFSQINMQNLGSVKVDNISDIQLKDFVNKYTDAGYSFSDVELQAKSRGMSVNEIEKLRNRISSLDLPVVSNMPLKPLEEKKKEPILTEEGQKQENTSPSRLFGASLFGNKRMSFEPSQNLPTPKNYQIGPGDELIIDVFGLSENTMQLTVSPEGYIRIPNVGQVQVSGKAIEEAENIIKKRLASIYSSINTGRTSVTVTLRNARSIKVIIVGEAAFPGTYTLSSLSTVFNALYACGGTSPNGSMRNISVLRDGKKIATVDLYSFLLKGELDNNITLQEQDVILIPPYENHVEVNGAVKREGIYEMKANETLADLISFSGGFSNSAYKDRISVIRNMDSEKSVADVPQELFTMFYPQAGDKYFVGKILDKFYNRVQIIGNVFRPGIYALEDGMTLKDLVEKADGLREDAFLQHATITRLQDDLTPEMISFSVQDFLNGNFNIELKKEDVVSIGTKSEFEEDRKVYIYGQVMAEGEFPYYENMTLNDLIFMAKGFKEYAATNRIELVRMINDPSILSRDEDKVEIFVLSVGKKLEDERGEGDFLLQPRDQISVRLIEGFDSVKKVDVLGEVRSPGSYAITSKKEKISDVLKRAGGPTQYSYLEGAFLLRKGSRSHAETMRDLKLISALGHLTDSAEDQLLKNTFLSRADLVGIQLSEILKKNGSKSDLFLEDGDIIFIPKQLQTVTVGGLVQVPGMIPYRTSSLKKYIDQSGGFTSRADKKKIYVAYPNGSIVSTKSFLFIKNYPKVEPGSHIFVPEKPERTTDSKEVIALSTSILGSLVSMASVVISVIILSQK
jgi:protein involved in polysaccharide export with SLBB domain